MAAGSSPFHDDEIAAQSRSGRRAAGASIRDFMPDQHRSFFEGLAYLFVTTTDAYGWPVATMLTGDVGFIRSPDPVTLRVAAAPHPQDPAASTLVADQEVGLLGLDFATRRRNRANGRIARRDSHDFTVAVGQSFGNCAKYIQRRTAHVAAEGHGGFEILAGLDSEAQKLICRADTFFVASRSSVNIKVAGGLDISHRGGRSGFVAVTGDNLTIPDYPGNHYYNTLGNLLGEPRASLLFLDFESGDLLQLQGIAEVDWDARPGRLVEGAERAWRLAVVRGWRRRAACPLRWSFVDYSPATLSTGVWHTVASAGPMIDSEGGPAPRSSSLE
jgi:uncharacterized protein